MRTASVILATMSFLALLAATNLCGQVVTADFAPPSLELITGPKLRSIRPSRSHPHPPKAAPTATEKPATTKVSPPASSHLDLAESLPAVPISLIKVRSLGVSQETGRTEYALKLTLPASVALVELETTDSVFPEIKLSQWQPTTPADAQPESHTDAKHQLSGASCPSSSTDAVARPAPEESEYLRLYRSLFFSKRDARTQTIAPKGPQDTQAKTNTPTVGEDSVLERSSVGETSSIQPKQLRVANQTQSVSPQETANEQPAPRRSALLKQTQVRPYSQVSRP